MSLLERAVAEKGADYVYERDEVGRCAYFNQDGSPSCLVGHILHYKGVTIDDLKDSRAWREDGMNANASVAALIDSGVLDAPYSAATLLRNAQINQDSGFEWGRAVEDALR